MHIYLQWDPWAIGTKKTIIIHKNTKTFDLVPAGQTWDSHQGPWISKPWSQLPAETHWRTPGTLLRGLQSYFCSLKGKVTYQSSDVFAGLVCEEVGQSSRLSSNETLPGRQRTLGASPWNHEEIHLLHIFLCQCHIFSTWYTHFCQPLPFPCQV